MSLAGYQCVELFLSPAVATDPKGRWVQAAIALHVPVEHLTHLAYQEDDFRGENLRWLTDLPSSEHSRTPDRPFRAFGYGGSRTSSLRGTRTASSFRFAPWDTEIK